MRFGGIFDYDRLAERLIEVVRELESPTIWNNPEQAQTLGRERAHLEGIVYSLRDLTQSLRDLIDLLDMAVAESDEAVIQGVVKDLDAITTQVNALEFQRMFSGKMDQANAYVDIQSGSGGTEAQDWAEMILRMYLRWGEQHGFDPTLIECAGRTCDARFEAR